MNRYAFNLTTIIPQISSIEYRSGECDGQTGKQLIPYWNRLEDQGEMSHEYCGMTLMQYAMPQGVKKFTVIYKGLFAASASHHLMLTGLKVSHINRGILCYLKQRK